MIRLIALFLGLGALLLLPFLIWGDLAQRLLAGDGALTVLAGFSDWAWLGGLLLLAGDLLLPIPATAVMAALGVLYGPLLGGVLASLGSFAGGSLGYLACRRVGRPAADRLLGASAREQGERWFARGGVWLVVISRGLPVLPETVACVAGLLRMPPARFFTGLACGTLPIGFGYASAGAVLLERPLVGLAVAVLLPALLWLLVRWLPRTAPPGGKPSSRPQPSR